MNRQSLPPEVSAFLRDDLSLPPPMPDEQPLATFFEDLLAANRSTNLTRITDWRDFCIRHVADSLSVLKALPEVRNPTGTDLSIADVGCGGGFPLIPLLWLRPHLNIVGVESRAQKVAFVQAELAKLGFPHARCLQARARELGHMPRWRNRFDVVVLRAVASAGDALRECRHLVGGGRIVCYKTPDGVRNEWQQARREAQKHRFAIRCGTPFRLPDNQGERQFLVFEKSADEKGAAQ